MQTRIGSVALAGLFLIALGNAVWSDDQPAEKPRDAKAGEAVASPDAANPDAANPDGAVAEVTEAQITQWIAELDSQRFRVRETATENLTRAGAPFARLIIEAAANDSIEVSARAMRVLKAWHESDDSALHELGREGLEELAKSDKESVADRAREIIAEAPQPRPEGLPGIPGFGDGQIQILGGLGGNVKISQRSDGNGNRTTDITRDGTNVKIEESPQTGIKVTITEPVDGKDKSTTYEAKDAKELKEKHPDAYRWFEQYVENGRRGFGQLNIGGMRIPGIPLPRGLNFGPPWMQGEKQATQSVNEARKRLTQAIGKLKRLAKADANADDLIQVAEELEAAERNLAEAVESLERGGFPFNFGGPDGFPGFGEGDVEDQEVLPELPQPDEGREPLR